MNGSSIKTGQDFLDFGNSYYQITDEKPAVFYEALAQTEHREFIKSLMVCTMKRSFQLDRVDFVHEISSQNTHWCTWILQLTVDLWVVSHSRYFLCPDSCSLF